VPGVKPADVQIGARSRSMCAAIRCCSAAMRFWRCSGVALGRCSGVALGRCSGVTLWRCSGVAQPRTADPINTKVADFHISDDHSLLLRRSFGAIDSRNAAASDGGAPVFVALIGRHRSMTWRSNYCAVDPGNSDVCPRQSPGGETWAKFAVVRRGKRPFFYFRACLPYAMGGCREPLRGGKILGLPNVAHHWTPQCSSSVSD